MDLFNTVSDVRQGADVPLPTLSTEESFVVIKVEEGGESARVTLYNLSVDEARDALLELLIALG